MCRQLKRWSSGLEFYLHIILLIPAGSAFTMQETPAKDAKKDDRMYQLHMLLSLRKVKILVTLNQHLTTEFT